MASLALGLAGAAVGSAFGSAAIGYAIGSFLGNSIFGQNKDQDVTNYGPRLENRNVNISSYGAMIPIVYGTMRIAGNVIWVRDNEIDEEEITSSQSVGKGMFGGGGSTVTNVSYRYTARMAILLCRGEMEAITRIWWNGHIVYDRREGASSFGSLPIEIYFGSKDQEVDPTIEEHLGVGEACAHRNYCYVVFKDVDLTKGGGTIGNWEFEVVSKATSGYPDPEYLEPDDYAGDLYSNPQFRRVGGIAQDPRTGLIWINSYDKVLVADPLNWETVAVLDIPAGWRTSGLTSDCMAAYQAPCQRVSVITGQVEMLPSRVWFTDQSVDVGPNGEYIGSLICAYNADTFSLDVVIRLDAETIDLLDSADMFMGTMAFDPASCHVYVWDSQFGSANGLGIDCWAPHGLTELVTNSSGSTHDAKVCYEYGYIVRVTESGYILVTGMGDTSQSLIYEGQCPWFTLSLYPRIAYDYTRGRIWVFGDINATGIGYFDLNNFTFTTVYSGTGIGPPCEYIPEKDVVICEYAETPITFPDPDINYADIVMWHADGSGDYDIVPFASADNLNSQSTNSSFSNIGNRLFYPPEAGGMWVVATHLYGIAKVYLDDLISSGSITLREVVEAISYEHKIHPREVDATALTEEIYGYIIGQQMTGRAAIEQLQVYGQFSGIESDSQIKFPLRNSSIKRNITEGELLISDDGEVQGDQNILKISRTEEIELPKEFTITHINKDNNYLPNTLRATRMTTQSTNLVNRDLSISMSDQQAKRKAEKLLDAAWIERNLYEFKLSHGFADIEPVDILNISMDDGTIYEVVVDKVQYSPGNSVDIVARSRDAAVYTNESIASSPLSGINDTVTVTSPTALFLADIPLLSDSQNSPGVYAWAAPYNPALEWESSTIYRAPDLVAFSPIAGISQRAKWGSVVENSEHLENWNTYGIDENGSITVRMNTEDSLSSITLDELEAGGNAALWGSEIIQFQTATLGATPNEFILTDLVRSRRGSELSKVHTSGERFILLEPVSVERLPTDLASRGLVRNYKSVTTGSDPLNAPIIPFTSTEAGLKPYAPTQVQSEWDSPASNDITISWLARSRVGATRLPDGITIGTGESTESYEIDILDDDGNVVRTIGSLSSKSITYTESQQTSDFGSARDWLSIRAYQLSSDVGRGFAKEAWIINPSYEFIEESFSGMPDGSPPTGWASEWDSVNSWDVASDGTATDGKYVAGRDTSNGSYAFSISDSERDPYREVLVRFRLPALGGVTAQLQGFRLFIRGNGDATSRDAVFFGVKADGSSWGVGTINDNQTHHDPEKELVTYSFSAATWYWARVRIRDQMIYAKVWESHVDIDEPTEWELTHGSYDFPDNGWVGFGFVDPTMDADIDYIRIAYGGEHA